MDPQPQRAARKLRSLSVTDGSRMGFDGDERGLAIANFVAGASCYRSAKHFAFRTVEKREHGQLSRAKNRLFLVATGLVPGWIALSGFWLFEDPSLALRANVVDSAIESNLRANFEIGTPDPVVSNAKTGRGIASAARLNSDINDVWGHMAQAMSLSAFNARIFTTLRAGFAFTVIISPGLNGLARCVALVAGLVMTVIFIRPGTLKT